jgi:UPF0716 protein FxsA
MIFRLITVLILVPLVEITFLVYLGNLIGIWYTIALVVITGITGAYVARRQGVQTLQNIRRVMSKGILPADQFLQGALIFAGGLLFMAPGLLTDLVGLGLLIPKTRLTFTRWLRNVLERHIQTGRPQYWEIR